MKMDFDELTKTMSWKTLNHFVELINIQWIYHSEIHDTFHAAMWFIVISKVLLNAAFAGMRCYKSLIFFGLP